MARIRYRAPAVPRQVNSQSTNRSEKVTVVARPRTGGEQDYVASPSAVSSEEPREVSYPSKAAPDTKSPGPKIMSAPVDEPAEVDPSADNSPDVPRGVRGTKVVTGKSLPPEAGRDAPAGSVLDELADDGTNSGGEIAESSRPASPRRHRGTKVIRPKSLSASDAEWAALAASGEADPKDLEVLGPGSVEEALAVLETEGNRNERQKGILLLVGMTGVIVALCVAIGFVLAARSSDEAQVVPLPSTSSTRQTVASSTSTSTTTSTTMLPVAVAPPTTLLTVVTAETTMRPTVTSRPVTTTTLRANQPLSISVTFAPARPTVGEQVTVSVVYRDLDATPTANCMVVSGDDGISFAATETCNPVDCPVDPSIGPRGGSRTFSFTHVYEAAGTYNIHAEGHSGDPECGNHYASTAKVDVPVEVVAASP